MRRRKRGQEMVYILSRQIFIINNNAIRNDDDDGPTEKVLSSRKRLDRGGDRLDE